MKNSRPDPFYFAPLKRLGGGWIAFKDSPSPPPAPDYTGAAQAQGAANLDAAVATAKLSNPNINSPYGSQTVTYGNPQFNQSAYDSAMAKYNGGQPTGPAPTQAQFSRNVFVNDGNGSGNVESQVDQNAYNQALSAYNAGGGPAPTRAQFTTTSDPYTANVTQTLNPQSQQIFDAQQQTRLGLAGLSKTGTDIAQGVLDKPFQFNGPGVQTSLGNAGTVQGSPNLFGFGSAGANVNAGDINKGPTAGQYGMAQQGVSQPGLQTNVGDYGQAQGFGRAIPSTSRRKGSRLDRRRRVCPTGSRRRASMPVPRRKVAYRGRICRTAWTCQASRASRRPGARKGR